MKKNLLSLLFAALVLVSFNAQAEVCHNCNPSVDFVVKPLARMDDGELSVMTVEVKDVVGNAKIAKKLQKQLSKVSGVQDVSVCTTSGTVKISYSKPEMGCCSKLHTAMDQGGYKYTLVSNVEKPACAKAKPACHGKNNAQ